MRAHHHVIAVAAVLVIGLGVKQYIYPPVRAEAGPYANVNVLQMQHDVNMKALPTQKLHDMTFVFDSD